MAGIPISMESSDSQIEPADLETIRSRLGVLRGMHAKTADSSSDGASFGANKLLDDLLLDFQGKVKQMEVVERDVTSLGVDDLEAYISQMQKEIDSSQAENLKMSMEVDALMKTLSQGSAQLSGDIEALDYSLKLVNAEGIHCLSSSYPDDEMLIRETHQSSLVFDELKFEILELDHKIEKNKKRLEVLQDLDSTFQRVEAIGLIEDMLSDVKVIEFEGSCIRLSLTTPIPTLDVSLLRQKLDCTIEPCMVEHELLIEVVEKTLDVKNIKIFPCDVHVDGFIDSLKSSRDDFSSSMCFLAQLVKKVQHYIGLCMLRRMLVEDANKSRHSFGYPDRDNTVTARLVGGIDAFIKLTQDWPISGSPLKLLSIKTSDSDSKSISLSFLCRVKELANSLDVQTRLHLERFADAIEEILVQEMRSEL